MEKSYRTLTEVTDMGPYVTKLIFRLPAAIKSDALCADTFSVYVERKNKETGEILLLRKSWTSPETAPSKGYCEVVEAYASDANGNKAEYGEYAALELRHGMMAPLTSAISPVGFTPLYIFSDFRITQIKAIEAEGQTISGLAYDVFEGGSFPQIEGWVNSKSTYAEMPLGYGYYAPKIGTGKRPLIIWLHGAGEGGVDPTLSYTGNNVVSLSSEKVQNIFGGAYVLAPQSPTFWMDNGSREYTTDGKSIYTAALKALIDEFITSNENIDKNRIYVGGCSNGGYMTMRLVVDYPGYFTAAYPICEALYTEVITDASIEDIKNTPIWFTHAKNDPVVKPELSAVPTYERLMKAGAKNVHFTFFDKVVDTTGKYKDAQGNPFEYMGHFSWVPMLKDECTVDYDGSSVKANGKDVAILEWLSLQSK